MKKYSQSAVLIVSLLIIHCAIIFDLSHIDYILYGCLLVMVCICTSWNIMHVSLLLFVMSVNEFYFPPAFSRLPSVWCLLPFLISTLLIMPFRNTRKTLRWLKVGNLDRMSYFLVFLTVIMSSASLLLWAFWTDNLGIGAQMFQEISHYPKWQILMGLIPLFALINGFAEEVVYRGVMQAALGSVFKSQASILGFQAAAFAAAHFAIGFPNGFVGYVMVFIYGYMLGYLRERTQGMFLPYIAHVFADLTIGYCLYYMSLVQ